jgi:ribonuclease G
MQNEIIINAGPGETRVALIERSVFTELHVEREQDKSVVGNVVKGRVSRVLPGMQAAFVDIGLEKAAFLYVGDYFDNTGGEAEPARRGRRNGRRPAPPRIDTVLSEGQEIVVQIAKAPIGSKGARITSNISIPGRHLVLTPWSRRVGVSRRIDSDKERRRLKEIVDRLRPKDLGFIIRTAGDGVREADLEADIKYLSSIWRKLHEANVEKPAPAVLHEEPDLPIRIIRDLANSETSRIVIDNADAAATLREFVEEFVADPKPEIEYYDGSVPLFDATDLEAQIHANLERKVWLKSGGSLIVDQCEALTAIDVNTGRFVGKRDLEETVFKTNLEAVKEVVHQLRFRNIGGLIIIDLIDMEKGEHRDKVYRALQEAIRSDKARTNILKISELGLVEMTRKRTRESLVQTLCEPCPHCEGRGYMLSGETVAYNILREIRNDLPRFSGRRIAITVSPRVAEQLLSVESEPLERLAEEHGREIEVRARPGLHQEQFEVLALDEGPPVEIPLRWLRDPAEIAAEEESERERKAESKAEKGRNGRRRSRGGKGRARGGREGGAEESAEDDAAATADGSAEGAAEGAADTPDGRGGAAAAGAAETGTDGTPRIGGDAAGADAAAGPEPESAPATVPAAAGSPVAATAGAGATDGPEGETTTGTPEAEEAPEAPRPAVSVRGGDGKDTGSGAPSRDSETPPAGEPERLRLGEPAVTLAIDPPSAGEQPAEADPKPDQG